MNLLIRIFYWLVNMSIAGTVVGAIYMAIRALRFIPRRYICAFWLMPALRFCLPFSVPGKAGLMPVIARFTSVVLPVDKGEFTLMNHIMLAEDYGADGGVMTFGNELTGTIISAAAVIWLAGVSALIFFYAAAYIRMVREFGNCEQREKDVYISKSVSSPAVYGAFRQRIILPAGIAESAEYRYVLLHERAHVARDDNLRRLIALAVACLHWFNPFAWLFLRCYQRDIELACDERAMTGLDGRERRYFAAALVNCALSAGGTEPVSGFGGAQISVRVKNILSYRTMTLIASAATLALLIVAAVLLLVNAPS